MRIHITITDENGNIYEGDTELSKVTAKNKARSKPIKSTKTKGPAEPIGKLYHQGYFKNEKKLGEVHSKLRELGFNFGKSSVAMALDRAEYLTRSGTRGNYVYIQKYPPS